MTDEREGTDSAADVVERESATAVSAPIYDDKAHVRGKLDLREAQWQRAGPLDDDEGEYVEVAFVPHTDGVTYVAMRNSKYTGPDDTVLVFTPAEWDAFVAGAKDGEFDEPW